ncbi:MAG: phage tail protein, partial [Desulfovibrio sp.]|nr:phage tail protein [Desulfovibrio sp.]
EGQAPALESAAVGAAVIGLQAGVFSRKEDNLVKQRVSLFWRGWAVEWQVYQRRVGGLWKHIGSTRDPQFDVSNLEVGFIYDFAVSESYSPASGEIIQVDYSLGDLSGIYQMVTEVIDGTEQPATEIIDGVEQNFYEVV